MAVALRPEAQQLVLPEPDVNQRQVLDSPARFKLARKGRRAGGSQVALIAAVAGHGPATERRGIVQGGLVIWVGPDYKQTDAIWREQIVPRFAGVRGVIINQADYRVELPGAGRLEVISANNVDAIRGRGPDGVVLDEPQLYDLEYAWKKVVRPALGTRQGWAMFVGTTNAGQDGNQLRRAPSFFNMLCAAWWNQPLPEGIDYPSNVMGADEWEGFHWRTRDCPRLPAEEIAKMYADAGGPESVTSQQELDALLILGGAGVAFPEYNEAIHVVPDREPPRTWIWYGTLDWGYTQGSYHLHAVSSEGDVEVVWEFYDRFKRLHAKEAAQSVFAASQYMPQPDVVYYDDQMAQDTGVKGGMRLIDQWYEGMREHFGEGADMPVMELAIKGPGSRTVKKNMVHAFLRYELTDIPAGQTAESWLALSKLAGRPVQLVGDKVLNPWGRPKLRIQRKCTALRRQLQSLPVDVRDLDDVDSSAEDHAYDDLGNLLLSRMRLPGKPEAPWSENQHPGIRRDGHRVRRVLTMAEEAEETFAEAATGGYRAPRWGVKYRDFDAEE